MVVDTEKCTPAWQKKIFAQLEFERLLVERPRALGAIQRASTVALADEWESLEAATVKLPAMVEASIFCYYDG